MITNTNNEKTPIKIIIDAAGSYSLCHCASSAPFLNSVTIKGLDCFSASKISLNIYGLSKSGFFVERTTIPTDEYFSFADRDELVFDLSSVSVAIRHDFFRNLKTRTEGKICVEAVIDGHKYLGDTPVALYPSNIYPKNATPYVFPSFLSPAHPVVGRIVSGIQKNDIELADLYAALRAERMIYSVRDCDFLSRDVKFEDIDSIYSMRSRMASPLEMAVIFCSCAVRAGLEPIVAVVKKSKSPLIFCGIKKKNASFDTVICSNAVLREQLSADNICLFDISCLFTGHSVEFFDALAAGKDSVFSEDVLFAVDICAAVSNGTEFSMSDVSLLEQHSAIAQSFRKKAPNGKKTLSDYAEELSDTENNPLLNFDFSDDRNIPVVFSDFSAVGGIVSKEHGIPLTSTADKFDIRRITKYGKGICSMLAPSSDYLRTELTYAEQQDTELAIEEYRNIIQAHECAGTVPTPLRQHTVFERANRLAVLHGSEKSIYLACGFLRYSGVVSPVALYPVELLISDGEVSCEFPLTKPYINRILCEKLRTSPFGAEFFASYGMPGGSFENIISCFESLVEKSAGSIELINECVIAYFPNKDTNFSFSYVDKYDRITTDKLSAGVINGGMSAVDISLGDRAFGACELERNAVDTFASDILSVASYALDGDIAVCGASQQQMYDVATSVACENLRLGHSTVIVSDSADVRADLEKLFSEYGLGTSCINISSDSSMKKTLRDKLFAVSGAEVKETCFVQAAEYDELRTRLDRRNAGKVRRYDFDFSFCDAADAYVRAGRTLSSEEKNILIEPEGLFFPDMSAETSKAVFVAQLKLCRAAAALGFSAPYSEHPFYLSKITEAEPNIVSCRYIADKSISELSALSEACCKIADNCGYDINDIKTFTALHSFISLSLHISERYSRGIRTELLTSDIYSVSKNLALLREISQNVHEVETKLSDFDKKIFELDAEDLLVQWNSQETLSHADILKEISSCKTDETHVSKTAVFDILSLLCSHKNLISEFSSYESEMLDCFGELYNGTDTDWNKLSSMCDFVKMADVLMKKIYGTDKQKRDALACRFEKIHEFCSDRINSAAVISAAEGFDRMFSEEGGFATLSEKLCADIYSMSFCNGLFSDNGILKTVSDWRENVALLPLVSQYNRCVEECEKIGLSGFVRYLDSNAYKNSTEQIFTRSLLFLALKQISLYDKGFISASSFDDDISRLSELHRERIIYNRAVLHNRRLGSAAGYVSQNRTVSQAFSESLDDRRISPEEILLRHDDTLKALFPIVIAEPAMCAYLSDYDNAVFLNADKLQTAKAIPVIHIARHRLIAWSFCEPDKPCFANDVLKSDIPCFSLRNVGAGEIADFASNPEISYIRTPVSSFDREKQINVLEAQTIGLEIIKLCENSSDTDIDVLCLTGNQVSVIKEVLSAVSEKSGAVLKAISERRVTVAYSGERPARRADVAFVSTVFGKEENGLCLSCAQLDDTSACIGATNEAFIGVLMGAAEKTVVVSSFVIGNAPDKIGSFGHRSLYSLCLYASSGATAIYPNTEREIYTAYVTALCELLSDNDIPVCVSRSGDSAEFEIDGKKYTAVFEKSNAVTTFDRECSAMNKGYNVVRLDGAELILNPLKTLDTIKSLGEGRT